IRHRCRGHRVNKDSFSRLVHKGPQPPVPGTTQHLRSLTMSCPDCFRGAVHTHAEPTGKIETLHGVKTYVAGGSDPSRSKSTIIYLPDAFSLKLVNNKILADKYASTTGCRVLIPDVVLNGGMPASVLESFEYIIGSPLRITNSLPKAWTILTLLPHAIPFMISGHPKNAYPKILQYAREVRAELP